MTIEFPKILPGTKAHLKLAPENRVIAIIKEQVPPTEAKDSAVLILLVPPKNSKTFTAGTGIEVPDWNLLLIKRNSYNGIHSNQMAFPGGKCDAGDKNYAGTACREAFEELGIERGKYKIIGQLTKLYVPPSNFTIYPIVAIADGDIEYDPDSREVSGYYLFPLSAFNPDKAEIHKVKSGAYGWVKAPGFKINNEIVWGATAMIIAELYEVLTS